MTSKTIFESERDPSQSTASAQSPTGAVVDRLAGLLPPEALEDALRGLEPDQITGPGGLLTQLAGRVIETALGAELTDHLGHTPGGVAQGPNVRNGAGRKTVNTDLGPVDVRTPRDRDGSFEPKLVAKRQTRLAGLDDKILGLYAGGMSVRDISEHLSDLYGVDVGRDTVSRVTDAVLQDVAAWRTAAGGGVSDRVFRLPDGQGPRGPLRQDPRLLPGDRRHRRRGPRGPRDLVAGVRGLQVLAGRPQRSAPARCRRHPRVLRRRRDRLPRGDRGRLPPGVGADLHRAPDQSQHALRHLPRPQARRRRPQARLPRGQRRRRPHRAGRVRRQVGAALPDDRRLLATALGAHHPLPRAARRAAARRLHHQQPREPQPPDPQDDQARGHFPDEQAATKLIYLAIQRSERKWRRAYHWTAALRGLKIHFADRLPD